MPQSTGPGARFSTCAVPGFDAAVIEIIEMHNQYFDANIELESLATDHADRFERVNEMVKQLLAAVSSDELRGAGITYDSKYVNAHKFKCRLHLGEIRARLNELGPWRWVERDNDNYGEYTSAYVLREPDEGHLKIFVEPDHYVVNLSLHSYQRDAEVRFARVKDALFEELLPALGARVLGETDTYE